ncbi:TlpA family protein disulfide reductase [Nocardioides daphniae]|uniref:Thiol-disulfide isomerase n=1 Tax=Nocardioides daphniae TaxID=402297 RepID=A0ABQ1Q2B1_9ACTN|nr:TlpA disulfide reductase family protein [Nocardioides daphniae]GGD11068.1 thiol-disulfide isomerase [Nocardioides daphniae]
MIGTGFLPRPLRTAVAALVPVVLLAIVLTGCSASDSGSPTATSSVVEQIAPEDRVEVEPFTGTQLDGEPFDSRDLAGQVVVYNVWGSWCAPCRTEAPALARVSRANEDNGVQFIGINVRDNDAAAVAFEDRYDIVYPSISTDTSSAALLAFGPALPPSAVPSTMVVDYRGRLAARVIGPVDESTLEGLIADVIADVGEATPEGGS